MSEAYDEMKRAVAQWAVDQVDSGMVVGLGSGSTAAYAIEAIGAADLDVVGVATSEAASHRAIQAGITITDLTAVDGIDVAIDGADQVADGVLLKGGGGAHTRERIVDAAADRFIVVVDERKVVDTIDEPVPLEVLPAARRNVAGAIEDLGGRATVRDGDAIDGPAFSERGNLLVDADMGAIDAPVDLAGRLRSLPGVVDHGLFLDEADEIAIGTPDGIEHLIV